MSRSIHKLLIANRGEIAARIMRSCRAMGIRTVAIYADPDRRAPFVATADEAIYIGPPMASASFLAIDKIVELARSVGADAVHPGYGFLAENADFADACAAAGISFVGPSGTAIRAMGNKTRAKELARIADVPVIPGFSADGLQEAEISSQAEALGLPVLLKAASGGGGKGMRVVNNLAELPAAIAAARRESKAAFGDDSLLVERYITKPRHIEIQILGDQHGNLIHCFERECSIQRRYQKMIEEAPSPAVDATLRESMTTAALRLAKELGYYSLGTVEFVVDEQRKFYFLEVNTRLQVEHPVTEEITGLDLVQLQIAIAEGAALPFGQTDLRITGHSIECRLCAEDPAKDFLPATGTIVAWEQPAMPGVRYESGVVTGSEVSIHYDSLLAKIIAHGPTRVAAVRRLAYALRRMRVQGIATNREFLIRTLESESFLAGEIDTHFVARHPELSAIASEQTQVDQLHSLAAALWQQAQRRASATVLPGVPSGWRNNPSQPQLTSFEANGATIDVHYRITNGDCATANLGNIQREVRIVDCDPAAISLEIDGIQRRFAVTSVGSVCFVHSSLGQSELHELARFPDAVSEGMHGGCQAPMPGKILAVKVATGDQVKRGQCLVVLEAMKMEHEVIAPHDGTVEEVRVEPGQQVNAGDVLIVIEEDEAGEA